jgi:hypothetical protein
MSCLSTVGLYQRHRVYMYVLCAAMYLFTSLTPHPRYWGEASHFVFILARLGSEIWLPNRTTLLIGKRNMQLMFFFFLQLWDREIWRWHLSHGCTTTGPHDEECCSCHHGWYHRRE